MPLTPETKRQDKTLVREVASGTTIQYPAKGRRLLILLCLVLGTFLVAIDTTIISVAIPTISTDFEALHDVGWYGSAYLMTLTAFQPTMSKIYKTFSAKAAYIASIALFEGMGLNLWLISSLSILAAIFSSAQQYFIYEDPRPWSLLLKWRIIYDVFRLCL